MALKDVLAEALDDVVEVDFSGAKSADPLPVDVPMLMEVVKCEPSMSQAGNRMVVFHFSPVDSEESWRVFRQYSATSGAGAGFFRSTAKALGFDTDTMKTFKCSDAVGRRAMATLRMQEDSDIFQEIAKLAPVAKTSGLK